MSTAAVTLFVMTFTMMGAGMLTFTRSLHHNTARSAQKQQANALAESGIHELYDQIREEMPGTGTYPLLLSEKDASSGYGGSTWKIGTYRAHIVDVKSSFTEVSEGSGWYRRDHRYIFQVEATGRSRSGITSTYRATFHADLSEKLRDVSYEVSNGNPTNLDTFGFPTGAMVSNNRIILRSRGGIRTYDSGGNAHLIANKGIEWNPSGGKSSLTNPNIIDIQGQYLVPGGSVYDFTIGSGGLGNSNGTKNYRNPSAPGGPGFEAGPENQVLPMSGEVKFANETNTSKWEADWRGYATGPSSKIYTSEVKTSAIAPDPITGQTMLRTPAFIDGDLTVEAGRTLRLTPSSTNPRLNVVYVRGDIKNMGQLMNLGVTVVVLGKYQDGPSSEYKLDNQYSPFGAMDRVSEKSALVSLSKSPDAISFKSNSSVRTGLIYAANGGVTIDSSNLEIRGMVLAGGVGENGNITVNAGGSNSFVVHYDQFAGIPGAVSGGSSGSVTLIPKHWESNFRPSEIYNWIQVK